MSQETELLQARAAARTWDAKERWFRAIGYKPSPGQLKVHQSPKRFKIGFGGRRFGKSMMAAKDAEPLCVVPGTRVAIVAPTYETGLKEFNFMYRDFAKTGWLAKAKSVSDKKEGPPHITWDNGWWLRVLSTEHPVMILGEEYDHVINSEPSQIPTEKFWKEDIRPALVNRQGSAMFPGTPRGFGWVYRLALKAKEKEMEPDWGVWELPATDNPTIKPEELEKLRQELSWQQYAEQVMGQPMAYSGLVYANFDPILNVRNWSYRSDLETFCFLDFGFLHPAVLWAQRDPEENIVIFDEYVEDNKTPEELADVLVDRDKRYNVDRYFGDPAGSHKHDGRGHIEAIRQRAGQQGRDINVRYTYAPQWTNILNGVDLVRSHLCNVDGLRRCFIARHLTHRTLTRGIYGGICGQVFEETKDGKTDRTNPLKEGFYEHVMDAFRYGMVMLWGTLGMSIARNRKWLSEEDKEERAEKSVRWPAWAETMSDHTGY